MSVSAVLLAVMAFVETAPAPRPPNVVYVLADDLGWGELGCYGQQKIRTPHIDRIAAEGMRFLRHYSGSPVCAPSRAVWMTGLHTGHAVVRDNWENGGWGEGAPEGQYPLPAGTDTLPRRLHAAGYATACVGKWGLGGPETTGHPNAQGFDLFFGHLCQRIAHNYYPTHLWRNDAKVDLEGNPWFASHQRLDAPPIDDDYRAFAGARYAPALMIDEAERFVREHAERPFLLWYTSPIPHAGLQVLDAMVDEYPSAWDEEPYLGEKGYVPHPRPRAAYAAMVTHLDREVGRLLDLLDELGLADDTIVIFSSDNGPTFNGGTDSAFFDSAPGLRGLKCSVHEGGIKVPMVARWPGRIAAGVTTDHLSAFQDVFPTVMELCGLEAPAGSDGVSFAPTLLGDPGAQGEHDLLYWEYARQQAVRRGEWKLVRTWNKDDVVRTMLFDLASDPGEADDVSDAHPERVAELVAAAVAERTPSAAFPRAVLDRMD